MSKLAIKGGSRVIPVPVQRQVPTMAAKQSLEQAFCEYCGVKYAISLTWGTSALDRGMAACQVGPGDEVIVPSFTWPASVNCILHFNGIPVFADIDEKTFTLDVDDVARKITGQTKAIIPVDFYGHPANMPAIMDLAKDKNILVVEDGCQATGAEIHGRKVGNIADVTAFSFSGKPIASSSGGVMVTDDELLYERARCAGEHPGFLSRLKNQELRNRFASTLGYGFKARSDHHGAAIGLQQLETLDERNDARIQNCNFLTKSLNGIEGLTTPYARPGFKHVYHYYTCLYDENILGVPRNVFLDAVRAEGLNVISYVSTANFMYFPGGEPISAGPVHMRPVFQEMNLYGKGCPFLCPHAKRKPDYSKGSLPVSERIVDLEFQLDQSQLSAPNDEKTMQTYVDVITKVVENIDELR